MRAGLAAVCLVIAVVASPGPRIFAQGTQPAASNAKASGDTKPPSAATDTSPPPSAPPGNAAPSGAPAAPTTPPETSQAPSAQPAPNASPPATAAPSPAPATPPPAPEATPSAAPPAAPAEKPAENAPAPPAANAPSGTPPSSAPPAEPSPPPAPAEKKPPPPTKSVLDKQLILGVLGKDVKSAKGEDMGRIVDVIVDWSGQTRAAIIDFGGFLGVGSRRIAVDWNALHFDPQQKGDQITLDLTRDQVKAAPEYKEGQPVVVLGPSGTSEPIPYD